VNHNNIRYAEGELPKKQMLINAGCPTKTKINAGFTDMLCYPCVEYTNCTGVPIHERILLFGRSSAQSFARSMIIAFRDSTDNEKQ